MMLFFLGMTDFTKHDGFQWMDLVSEDEISFFMAEWYSVCTCPTSCSYGISWAFCVGSYVIWNGGSFSSFFEELPFPFCPMISGLLLLKNEKDLPFS